MPPPPAMNLFSKERTRSANCSVTILCSGGQKTVASVMDDAPHWTLTKAVCVSSLFVAGTS